MANRESGDDHRYDRDDNSSNMNRQTRNQRVSEEANTDRDTGMRRDRDRNAQFGAGQYSRDQERDSRENYGRADYGYGPERSWPERSWPERSWDDQNRDTQGGFRNRDYGAQNPSWGQTRDWSDRNTQSGYGRGRDWGGGYNEGGYDQRGNDFYGNRDFGAGNYGGHNGGDYATGRQGLRPGQTNPRYPYSGQGAGGSYGEGYGRDRQTHRHADHPDYMKWREEQVRKLDEDYDDYRKETQTKFNTDFDTWRAKRPKSEARSGEKDKSSNPNATTKQ